MCTLLVFRSVGPSILTSSPLLSGSLDFGSIDTSRFIHAETLLLKFDTPRNTERDHCRFGPSYLPTNNAHTSSIPVLSTMHVTILYGSETGNAESIAKDLGKSINEAATEAAFTTADVFEMNQFKRKKLMETWVASPANGMARHALIVVCSTTGNGDAPENAGRFVRFIKKPVPESLSKGCADPTKPLTNVVYATLGLGDTNYDQFCASGKLLDRKLNEWGAVRALPLVCADEATGLDSAVEPFLNSVLDGLARACEAGDRKEGEGVDGAFAEGVATISLTQEANPKPDVKRGSECSATDEEKSSGPPPASEGVANESNGTASSKPKTEQTASKSASPLYILYGSATGNAEHIAKDLTKTYETYLSNPSYLGYFTSVQCCELNKYQKNCLDTWSSPPDSINPQVKHGIIIVCSTTGNADAPENADRFVRWIKRKTTKGDTFQHCAYAVLGLGDTNYDVFCAMGKIIDKRLEGKYSPAADFHLHFPHHVISCRTGGHTCNASRYG